MKTEALRELLAAATRGPWVAPTKTSPHIYKREIGRLGEKVATVRVTPSYERDAADAALIVAAINALPALLDVHDAVLALIHRPHTSCPECGRFAVSRVEEARAELVVAIARLRAPELASAIDGYIRALFAELTSGRAAENAQAPVKDWGVWLTPIAPNTEPACWVEVGDGCPDPAQYTEAEARAEASDRSARARSWRAEARPFPAARNPGPPAVHPPRTGGNFEVSVAAPYHGGGGPRLESSTMWRMPSVYAVGAIDETDPIAVMVWTSRQAAEESADGEVVVEYRPLPPPAASQRDAPPTGETADPWPPEKWDASECLTHVLSTLMVGDDISAETQNAIYSYHDRLKRELAQRNDGQRDAGRTGAASDPRRGDEGRPTPVSSAGRGDGRLVSVDRSQPATPTKEEGDRVHQPGARVEDPQAVAPSASGPAEVGAECPHCGAATQPGKYHSFVSSGGCIDVMRRRIASERSARVAAEEELDDLRHPTTYDPANMCSNAGCKRKHILASIPCHQCRYTTEKAERVATKEKLTAAEAALATQREKADEYKREWESACERLKADPHNAKALGLRVGELNAELATQRARVEEVTSDRDRLEGLLHEQSEYVAKVTNERDTALATVEKLEAANREERDEWSRTADVLGLAPYGGAYNPKHVRPVVEKLRGELGEARTKVQALINGANATLTAMHNLEDAGRGPGEYARGWREAARRAATAVVESAPDLASPPAPAVEGKFGHCEHCPDNCEVIHLYVCQVCASPSGGEKGRA